MTIIIPNNTDVIEAARRAHATHLHLITDGKRTVLSPIILPGWFKVGVFVKGLPCAA